MRARILAFVMGVTLFALVVWLGLRAEGNQAGIVAFGVTAATLPSIGLGALRYAIAGSMRGTVTKLAKVPRIEELIAKAESEERRLQELAELRRRMEDAVRIEASRLALQARQEELEEEAKRVLAKLQTVDATLADLDEEAGAAEIRPYIEDLQARLDAKAKGDIVFRFRGQIMRIDTVKLMRAVPGAPGVLLGEAFRVYVALLNALFSRRQKTTQK